MERRPSSGPKLTPAEFETFQKRLADQMKQHVTVQSEMLKAMTTYRAAVDQVASAADKLSQLSGKFAVCSISAFQINKEYHMACETEVPSESELKQKNLSLALQQVVKFHTLLAQQQQTLSTVIAADFERPIQANLEKFKDIANSWEKNTNSDIKRAQSDIKAMEHVATKQGKKPAPDMSKLSSSLQELSFKVSELERLKLDALESAITTDHYQSILVAHHLQRVLKQEISGCRAIYYQDGVTKSSRKASGAAEMSNQISSARSSLTNGPTSIITSGPLISRKASSTGSSISPTTRATSSRTGIREETIEEESPVPPPRRTSNDEPSTPSPKMAQQSFGNLPQVKTAGNDLTLNPESLTNMPEKHPSIYTMSRPIHTNEPTFLRSDFVESPAPDIPSKPHRRTLIAPSGSDFDAVESVIQQNFGRAHLSPSPAPTLTATRKSAVSTLAPWSKKQQQSPRTKYEQYSNNNDGDDGDSEQATEEDMALVIYDFIGTEADDLNALEGDVLRIVTVEGEWVYGLLLTPAPGKSEEYIPAVVNGAHQVGWIPMSFTAPI